MLTAETYEGRFILADYDIDIMPKYFCRECRHRVVPKLGEVMTPHFAHMPDNPAECAISVGESIHHEAGKRWVAEWFTELGCHTNIEVPHEHGRRIDVTVEVPKGRWPTAEGDKVNGRRFAIEVQGSAISAAEIRQRNVADAQAGYAGTLWLFVGEGINRWSKYRDSLRDGILFEDKIRRVDATGHIMDTAGAIHLLFRDVAQGRSNYSIWQVRARTVWSRHEVTDFDIVHDDSPIDLIRTIQGGRLMPAAFGGWKRSVANMLATSIQAQRFDLARKDAARAEVLLQAALGARRVTES